MYTSKSEMSQFSQPWWFHKAFAINGGWWSPGFVRARNGICSKISLSTQSLNCWTGVWNNSRTFYNYLKHSALSTFSLFEEHAQARFVGVLPIPLKHYIAQGNDARDCFAITGYSVHHKIRSPELQTITDASLSRNDQSPSVSNSWRGWSCAWSERTHCMENGQIFFSCLTHPKAHVHVRFLSYAKLILRKNPTVL